ncbi:MAG: FAD-dependent oxidoreductase, partial [Gammaproteobacteria bacterium]|nr:FAD-dependent oxidoreductase [Gammaproteobacteria bacterium]
MTSNADVLVVGGGPAGVAAACRVAEAGRTVRLCDQAPAPGGAIFRGPSGSPLPMPAEHKATWREISERLERNAAAIQVMTSTSFVGLDSNGVAVLKDCKSGEALQISPQGVIFATGAIESVRPVPGW